MGLLLLLPLLAGPVRAQSGFDTSSPVAFFSSLANKFIQAEPALAQQGLSITNIPIYPSNCYTPSVHRLLQLAANIYDASTNKTSAPPDDFDYPSVFRPTFWVTNIDGQTYVYINGYQEVPAMTMPASPAKNSQLYGASVIAANPLYLSAPVSLSAVSNALPMGQNYTNIYGIPWVVGAKKGLPNFNQISMESFTALTRKIQIVKGATDTAPRNTWQTNVQYVLSVSNAVVVEAWNSYSSNYPRAIDIGGLDTLTTTLSNAVGQIAVTPSSPTITVFLMTLPTIPASTWQGTGPNLSSNQSATFRFPLETSEAYVSGGVYSTNAGNGVGLLTQVLSPFTTPFTQNTGNQLPTFLYNLSNNVQFVMLDDATGRVIDYVQLDGMGGQRSLTSGAEMLGNDDWGPGGVWDTNRIPIGSRNPNSLLLGIQNQIFASTQSPPFTVPPYSTPVTANDWNASVVQTMGFSSITAAAASFNAFYNGNTAQNSFLFMQVPFTPTRNVCVYYTWQANDPLVHYTLPDLSAPWASFSTGETNWVATNIILGNLGQINRNYNPWGGSLYGFAQAYETNLTLEDPLITRSDDWNFPAGSLNFSSLGSMHRGTPWQTVYLKSAPADPNLWQAWTGNPSAADAAISQPTNDWRLAALLAPLLNPVDPTTLDSVNQSDFSSVLDGLTAVSNTIPSTYFVMDSNSPQVFAMANAVNAWRDTVPGGLFISAGDVLAVPELSVSSPWLNPGGATLSDSDYELIPSQLLALLRPDSIGSVNQTIVPTQIQFTGMDGYSYQVQASTDFQNWFSLGTQFTSNGVLTVADPSATNFPARYYRTLLLPTQ